MPGGPKDSKEASAVGGKAVSGESSWRWVGRGGDTRRTISEMTKCFSKCTQSVMDGNSFLKGPLLKRHNIWSP